MKEAKWHTEATFNDEIIARQKQRLGNRMRLDNMRNTWVDPDNVRIFANAIGDRNPLWRDPEYAKKTKWGAHIASPAYFNNLSTGEIMQGMPGIQAFHASTRWEFFKPAYIGDKLRVEAIFKDLVEKKSALAPRWFIEYYENSIYNQYNELVARNLAGMIRTERSMIRGRGLGKNVSKIQVPHAWTDEERTKLEDEMLASDIVRGAVPRYWEDTNIGEELPTLLVGPLRMSDLIAWYCGKSLYFSRGAQVWIEYLRKHPGMGMVHPESNATECIIMVHHDNIAGRTTGLPGAYDLGAQRQAYLTHSLTNWAGDEGWLKICDCQYRSFVYIGDAIWFKAKVAKKYIDTDGEFCVDIESHTLNQRGEDTMPGTSTIVLPSREKNFSPVESRRRINFKSIYDTY